MPYAIAIKNKQANRNQCPPGGQETIKVLATLLQCEELPLSPEFGTQRDFQIAKINEELCIGCVKCIRVCPVDAIIGAAKQMHSVIEQYCTGCELCITPCPVDCIDMVEPPEYLSGRYSGYNDSKAVFRLQSKARYNKHQTRILQQQKDKQLALEEKQAIKDRENDIKQKQSFIKAAIERSQTRRKKNTL